MVKDDEVEQKEDSAEADALMGSGERFVVLLRHGIAEERTGSKPDEDRHLTTEGHARMKQAAKGLTGIFPKAQSLYSSPLLRCIQTSIWVTKNYHKKVRLQSTDALRPGADPAAIIDLVKSMSDRRIILVGHEPHLTATMLAWTGLHPGSPLELKKGGCYGIRVSGDTAWLEWILPPRVLRRIVN
jgi:phosphohistidine phosphatase